MEINSKKNHLFCIRVSFIMLLLAMCLTINVFFCSSYNFYEFLDKTTAIESWDISEGIVVKGDGNNTTNSEASFSNENNSYPETITKNLCPTSMIAAIPNGISQLLFPNIFLLYFFLYLFILLPDGWTLINQKVRLDN